MHFLTLALLLGAAPLLHAKEVFLTERGSYDYTLAQVAMDLAHHQVNYVLIHPEAGRISDRYKLNKRGEFQIKDWFKQDWYELQDLFTLDEEAYRKNFKGETFLEAKRNAYSQWKFNKKTKLHQKPHPIMKEWGGLNHPPIKKLTRDLRFYAKEQATPKAKLHSHFYDPAFQRSIDEISKSELSFGNTLKLEADRDAFKEKMRLIKNAKYSVLMSSLVFVCDQGTRELTKLLIEKHREGLDIRILADHTISKYLKHMECLNTLRNSGIEVLTGDDFWRYKGRTIYHSKMLVVDFEHAVVGGHNMIDADNLSRGVDFKNRDVDLKITGPMVRDVALGFLTDWQHFIDKKKRSRVTSVTHLIELVQKKMKLERAQGLRGHEHYSKNLTTNGVCRFIRQSPYEDGTRIGKVYLAMMKATENYLALTNAVFADSKVTLLNRAKLPPIEWADSFKMYNQLFDQLQSMAKKGLTMDFVTTNIDMAGNENVAIFNQVISEEQSRNRDWVSNWNLFKIYLSNAFYGEPHYKNMLKDWVPHKNVRLWTHISFMHSKVVHFDRLAASIGSYNIQHNATDHAYEVTTLCQDDTLNRELDHMFVEDMVNSIPLVFR